MRASHHPHFLKACIPGGWSVHLNVFMAVYKAPSPIKQLHWNNVDSSFAPLTTSSDVRIQPSLAPLRMSTDVMLSMYMEQNSSVILVLKAKLMVMIFVIIYIHIYCKSILVQVRAAAQPQHKNRRLMLYWRSKQITYAFNIKILSTVVRLFSGLPLLTCCVGRWSLGWLLRMCCLVRVWLPRWCRMSWLATGCQYERGSHSGTSLLINSQNILHHNSCHLFCNYWISSQRTDGKCNALSLLPRIIMYTYYNYSYHLC